MRSHNDRSTCSENWLTAKQLSVRANAGRIAALCLRPVKLCAHANFPIIINVLAFVATTYVVSFRAHHLDQLIQLAAFNLHNCAGVQASARHVEVLSLFISF